MRIIHPGGTEKHSHLAEILAWGLLFLLGVTLVLGHVKYYELTQENQTRQESLDALRKELVDKQKQRQCWQQELTRQAEELGLYQPQMEEYKVINVE